MLAKNKVFLAALLALLPYVLFCQSSLSGSMGCSAFAPQPNETNAVAGLMAAAAVQSAAGVGVTLVQSAADWRNYQLSAVLPSGSSGWSVVGQWQQHEGFRQGQLQAGYARQLGHALQLGVGLQGQSLRNSLGEADQLLGAVVSVRCAPLPAWVIGLQVENAWNSGWRKSLLATKPGWLVNAGMGFQPAAEWLLTARISQPEWGKRFSQLQMGYGQTTPWQAWCALELESSAWQVGGGYRFSGGIQVQVFVRRHPQLSFQPGLTLQWLAHKNQPHEAQ